MVPEDSQLETYRPALRPPQFGLRTMFWIVGCVALVLGVQVGLGTVSAAALTMLLLLIAAHVSGNALGKQLRDGGGQAAQAPSIGPFDEGPAKARQRVHAVNGLAEKQAAHWATLLAALVGAAGGGMLGGIGLALHYWDRIAPAAVVVGGLASGVLGGLLGFAASSFIGHTTRAWREMWGQHHESRPFAAGVYIAAMGTFLLLSIALYVRSVAW